jgi:hypothetical protein
MTERVDDIGRDGQANGVGATVAHARVFAVAVQLRWSALQFLQTESAKRCASTVFNNLSADVVIQCALVRTYKNTTTERLKRQQFYVTFYT